MKSMNPEPEFVTSTSGSCSQSGSRASLKMAPNTAMIWEASSSCRRASSLLLITAAARRHERRPPYGETLRILSTRSAQLSPQMVQRTSDASLASCGHRGQGLGLGVHGEE